MAYRHNTELGGPRIAGSAPIPVDHSITVRRAGLPRCSPPGSSPLRGNAADDAHKTEVIRNDGLGWPARGRAYRTARPTQSTPSVPKASSTSIRHSDELRWQWSVARSQKFVDHAPNLSGSGMAEPGRVGRARVGPYASL